MLTLKVFHLSIWKVERWHICITTLYMCLQSENWENCFHCFLSQSSWISFSQILPYDICICQGDIGTCLSKAWTSRYNVYDWLALKCSACFNGLNISNANSYRIASRKSCFGGTLLSCTTVWRVCFTNNSNTGLSLQESIIILHLMLSCSFECVEYIESLQK